MDIEKCSNCDQIISTSNRKNNYKITDYDESNNYLFCKSCRIKKGNANNFGYRKKSMEIYDEYEDD